MSAILTGLGAAAIGGATSLLTGSTRKAERRAQERALELLKEQEASQERLNESNALRNYQYGERAADAAHERSLALHQAQVEANSYEAQVADAENAGLSVGLLYGSGGGGGGGTAGGGAQGGGAGNQRGQVGEYLDVLTAVNNAKLAEVERRKVANEARLVSAEMANIIQDTKLKAQEVKESESNVETSSKLTPIQASLLEEQAIRQFIENAENRWKATSGGKEVETAEWKNGVGEFKILKGSKLDQEVTNSIIEAQARANKDNAVAELDTERKKHLFQQLLNETKDADSKAKQAAAVKLAAEWQTGEYTNWKTWVDVAEKTLGNLSDIITSSIKGGK